MNLTSPIGMFISLPVATCVSNESLVGFVSTIPGLNHRSEFPDSPVGVSARLTFSFRPVAALVAGIAEEPGRIMGHAGAFTTVGEPNANAKITALESAGATVVGHPAEFGDALKARLEARAAASGLGPGGGGGVRSLGGTQRRQFHTVAHRPRHREKPKSLFRQQQRRHLYISEDQCMDLLRQTGKINCDTAASGAQKLLGISIDRTARSPCIIASPTAEETSLNESVERYPFDYGSDLDALVIEQVARHLQLSPGESGVKSLRHLLKALTAIFYDKEAFFLSTSIVENSGELMVVGARFGFDDAAYRSCGRQAELQQLRNIAAEDPCEIEAEKNCIVYIKLKGPGTIGTLVNGAGLAMNTVDALAGHAANFLDTGGKATSQTVKQSFEIILRDPRVRVIFVNIFGGLTLGDMIARGIIMAFKELSPSVPVVVRIRGTNERKGQRLISESGLPLYAFDDFEAAAAKAIELSKDA